MKNVTSNEEDNNEASKKLSSQGVTDDVIKIIKDTELKDTMPLYPVVNENDEII